MTRVSHGCHASARRTTHGPGGRQLHFYAWRCCRHERTAYAQADGRRNGSATNHAMVLTRAPRTWPRGRPPAYAATIYNPPTRKGTTNTKGHHQHERAPPTRKGTLRDNGSGRASSLTRSSQVNHDPRMRLGGSNQESQVTTGQTRLEQKNKLDTDTPGPRLPRFPVENRKQ
jgi:hypothetical protein